jgi:hypothetical protein
MMDRETLLRDALEHVSGCRVCLQGGWASCAGGRQALALMENGPSLAAKGFKLNPTPTEDQ